jgi:hypothetical protein
MKDPLYVLRCVQGVKITKIVRRTMAERNSQLDLGAKEAVVSQKLRYVK